MSEKRISGGKNRPLQVAEVRANEWTQEKRQLFLDELAESCNVRQSAIKVGMSDAGLYVLKRKDAAFAAAWAAALRIGYQRLEERLLEHSLEVAAAMTQEASAGANAAEGRAKRAMTGDEIKLSIFLLSRYAATVDGTQGRIMKSRRASREETNAALKAKLDALDQRMKAIR